MRLLCLILRVIAKHENDYRLYLTFSRPVRTPLRVETNQNKKQKYVTTLILRG